MLHTTLVGSFCSAADFKRHVGDVEAALARKTDELHQYRHKLEAELSGMCYTHSHVHFHVTLYVPTFEVFRIEMCPVPVSTGSNVAVRYCMVENNQHMVCGDRQLNMVGLISELMLNPNIPSPVFHMQRKSSTCSLTQL